MDKFSITGPCRVMRGEVLISGSKNATLPILAATILSNRVKLKNIPLVKDVLTMAELLSTMGSIVRFDKKKNEKLNEIVKLINE